MKRKVVAAAAGVGLLGALVGVAGADNVVNDVTVSSATITIAPGGSATVGYKINGTGGDGQQGCNASDGSAATLTIQTPAGVTATPPALTFAACNAFQYVTFSAGNGGSYGITHSLADSGFGTYAVHANWTLKVEAANTAPTVAVTGVSDGGSYELGSVPAAGCSVTDAEDGPSTHPAALSAVSGLLSPYGLGSQTATCSHTDSGGLTAVQQSVTYSIGDSSAPSVTCEPSDGAWHNANVSSVCTASDSGSGLATVSPFSLTTSVASGVEDADASTNSMNVLDNAGNSTTAGPISGFKIDMKAPTAIEFVGTAWSGSYIFGALPAAPTCTATDGGSGLLSCVVTNDGTGVGTHTLTATATDNVGNSDTITSQYTVLPWNIKGFYSPVDMAGVVNTVKGGSTVPLKFEVFAGPSELTTTSALSSFKTAQVNCGSLSTTSDEIEITGTGGTSLRYDTTGGQYIQNWQTPRSPGACYRVTMTAADGFSSTSAFFKLK